MVQFGHCCFLGCDLNCYIRIIFLRSVQIFCLITISNLLKVSEACSHAYDLTGRRLVQQHQNVCLSEDNSPRFVQLHGKADTIYWNIEQ